MIKRLSLIHIFLEDLQTAVLGENEFHQLQGTFLVRCIPRDRKGEDDGLALGEYRLSRLLASQFHRSSRILFGEIGVLQVCLLYTSRCV